MTQVLSSLPPALALEASSYATKPRRHLDRAKSSEVEGMRLGKYPFVAGINKYLAKRYGTIADSTYTEDERKLKYIGEVFDELKGLNKVSTTDPRHMTCEDLQQFMGWMRGKKLDPTTQLKYLNHLNGMLRFFKNHVIDEMKADGVNFPRKPPKAIRTIPEEDIRRIFATLDVMKGWHGSLARGMCALAFATWVRPKEFRLAEVKDLDLIGNQFFVRNPKGQQSWGTQEWVQLVIPEMIPYLIGYIKEREEYLALNNRTDSKALFPNLKSAGNGDFYSANGVNQIKTDVEKASKVRFRMKDWRSTGTSLVANMNPDLLPSISGQLRHQKPETTTKYYADIKKGVSGRKVAEAMKDVKILGSNKIEALAEDAGHDEIGPKINSVKSPVIKNKFPPAGYG
jgi:integrase